MSRAAGAQVPQLTRWGTSADADLVYRTLLRFGPATAAVLAQNLGMPVRRVRLAVDELAAASAVLASGGVRQASTSVVWSAAPPTRVVHTLKTRQVEQVRAAYLMRRYLASLDELEVTIGPGAPGIRPIDGRERTRARIAEISATERQELLSMQPVPSFDLASVQAASPLTTRLCRRGAQVRALGVPPAVDDASAEHGRQLFNLGMRYRELTTLPAMIMIYGRTTAIVPQVPEETGRGALEVTEPETVNALVRFFLKFWDQAGDSREKSKRVMELTPRERAIVRLLAAGHTDTSASTELGLSVRTIAYTLRDLMDRCQVSNRFQLGLVLGAAYLLDPPPAEPDTTPETPDDSTEEH